MQVMTEVIGNDFERGHRAYLMWRNRFPVQPKHYPVDEYPMRQGWQQGWFAAKDGLGD